MSLNDLANDERRESVELADEGEVLSARSRMSYEICLPNLRRLVRSKYLSLKDAPLPPLAVNPKPDRDTSDPALENRTSKLDSSLTAGRTVTHRSATRVSLRAHPLSGDEITSSADVEVALGDRQRRTHSVCSRCVS